MMAQQQQDGVGKLTTADCTHIIESRQKEATNGMPACIARMVAEQEELQCTKSGHLAFRISQVMDGGGFATLLKGQLHCKDVSFNQVRQTDKRPLRQQSSVQVCCQHSCVSCDPVGCRTAWLTRNGWLHVVQVAVAKIALDMTTDEEGRLTPNQRRSYQASMRHEHHIYERLQATHGSRHGIPTVFFAGRCLLARPVSCLCLFSANTCPAACRLGNKQDASTALSSSVGKRPA